MSTGKLTKEMNGKTMNEGVWWYVRGSHENEILEFEIGIVLIEKPMHLGLFLIP